LADHVVPFHEIRQRSLRDPRRLQISNRHLL
jgi:hypothetical protein